MSNLLREAGEALYGSRWQSELARDLGVADRTVRKWAAGDSPVPESAYAKLATIAKRRAHLIAGLIARLRR